MNVEELLMIKDLALQNLFHAIAISDLNGIIIFANREFIKLWECSDENEILGRHVSDFSNTPELVRKAVFITKTEGEYTGEDMVLKKNGEPFYFQISVKLITGPEGNPVAMIACILDITERKKMEETLKEYENNYSRVMNQLNDVVWSATSDGSHILDLNKSFENIYGVTIQQFIDNPNLWIEVVHRDDRKIAEESSNELYRNGCASAEYRIIRPNGEIRWVLDRKFLVYNKEGQVKEIGGFATDITQRKELEEKIKQVSENLERMVKERTSELEKSHRQIRAYAGRLHAIREEERTAISREIHDEIGHIITALKLEIENLISNSETIKKPLKVKLIPMINMIDAIFDSIRMISSKLRPGVIDHFGLIQAMKWEILQFTTRNRVKIKSKFDIRDDCFTDNEAIAIYRIFQEILNNISRHSKATEVNISIKRIDHKLILEVEDNGVGFEINKSDYISAFGLTGMQERAISIGGKLTIKSSPSVGTTVILILKNH